VIKCLVLLFFLLLLEINHVVDQLITHILGQGGGLKQARHVLLVDGAFMQIQQFLVFLSPFLKFPLQLLMGETGFF